ncbi:hypothetical protein [Flavobacterium sp. GNP002]
MELKIVFLLLFFIYLILSLVAQRFQSLTNQISRAINNGNLDVEFQADMTPKYIGAIVVANFLILGVLFFIIFFTKKWYYALGVLFFLFIPPFFELFVPLLPHKTMLRIIKKELIKNISKSPEYVLIIEDLEKNINQK